MRACLTLTMVNRMPGVWRNISQPDAARIVDVLTGIEAVLHSFRLLNRHGKQP